jgi:hypothetical protein
VAVSEAVVRAEEVREVEVRDEEVKKFSKTVLEVSFFSVRPGATVAK